MHYPKVLIIGQYFDKKSGGGITMTNLFYGWDKQCIAAAAFDIKNPDYTVCDNYYSLGSNELRRSFPLNLGRAGKIYISGIINRDQEAIENSNNPKKVVKRRLERNKASILLGTGLIHKYREFIISEEFLNWINEFSPDLLYSQLSSVDRIRLMTDLILLLKIPFIIHMMDDWPVTITFPQKCIFKSYWENQINKEFSNLMNKASLLLSISDFMSQEYQRRYGHYFIPFHNPIDLSFWNKAIKKHSQNYPFVVLYAGRIGTGLSVSLLEVANAIKYLNDNGLNIEMHIQATNYNPILQKLSDYHCVVLRNPVKYEELPEIFAKADLLLLPNDFDEKSISFLKYSMPTKASEYMISGTPILVYSNHETAVSRHALIHKWAYVVSENSIGQLISGIQKLYSDQSQREELGQVAHDFAEEHFDSIKIRMNFLNELKKTI